MKGLNCRVGERADDRLDACGGVGSFATQSCIHGGGRAAAGWVAMAAAARVVRGHGMDAIR